MFMNARFHITNRFSWKPKWTKIAIISLNLNSPNKLKDTFIKGTIQVEYKFASKLDQICIDFNEMKSFVETFLFMLLEQNQTFLVRKKYKQNPHLPPKSTHNTGKAPQTVLWDWGCCCRDLVNKGGGGDTPREMGY